MHRQHFLFSLKGEIKYSLLSSNDIYILPQGKIVINHVDVSQVAPVLKNPPARAGAVKDKGLILIFSHS